MRRRTHALLLALVLVLLAGCAGETVASPIIAQVGNTYITEAQFTNFMEFQIDFLKQNNPDAFAQIKQQQTPEQFRQSLFDMMIQEEIALSEARRTGAGLDSEQAAQIAASIDAQVRGEVGRPLSFGDYQSYVDTKKLESFAALRGFTARNFSLDEYAQTITVDDPTAPVYPYIREVIVPAPESMPPEEVEAARQRAAGIAQQLRAGASLDPFVAELSAESPEISRFQGDLGWIDTTGTGPDFEQAANTLAINEYSDPARTVLGWHVFKITQRAQFPSWRVVTATPAGQAFLQQKTAEYQQKGELNYYYDISKIPLPASFDDTEQK